MTKTIPMTPQGKEAFDKAVRGAIKTPLKEQDPRDIIGRCLTLERLRSIPIEKIEELVDRDKHFAPFLLSRTSKAVDKNGKPMSKGKIDFEYALFDATQREVLDLFGNFVKVKKGDAGKE